MVSDSADSDLEMDGEIFSVSAAHSGRFACAYLPENVIVSSITSANSIKVGVFECESSGGVEWLREDTLVIDNKSFIEQQANAQDDGLREGFETREEGWPPAGISSRTRRFSRRISNKSCIGTHCLFVLRRYFARKICFDSLCIACLCMSYLNDLLQRFWDYYHKDTSLNGAQVADFKYRDCFKVSTRYVHRQVLVLGR
uniref:Uncharacterized protein n=1 Tax=Parascaris equorum TaxID=6256 RepID=A0A914RYN9_PAREQ